MDINNLYSIVIAATFGLVAISYLLSDLQTIMTVGNSVVVEAS